MSQSVCRWGILGAAGIARKNWQAIHDAGNATLTAVASRDAARCATFVAECQRDVPFPAIPRSLGSYEELLAAPDVDAVYIPLPTGLRKPWVLRAAEAGKHVLVEKPVGNTAPDVAEMAAACAGRGVQLMDGVMFMHTQRLQRLRQVLDDPQVLGRLRRITTQFSFDGGEEFLRGNIRMNSTLEPQGCLGDLGWYCIRFALWAMNYELPVRVTGRILSEGRRADSPAPVPTEFSGELFFANGVSASFYNSFITENQQWAHASGSKGFLQVPDFVLPFQGGPVRFSVTKSKFKVKGCQFDMRENRADEFIEEPGNNAPGSQESRLFRRFSEIVLSGKLDPHWPDIALKTQRVMDACLVSARNGSVETPVG
jgi:predicted dehydrogenase